MLPFPATLKALLEKEDLSGFRLAVGHYAELKHGAWGIFPAIETQSKQTVLTIDLDLLKRVCETLSPRRSKFETQLIYVHRGAGIAYSIFGQREEDLEKATPYEILTQARFDTLMANKQPAFQWKPGYINDEMSTEEFLETVALAQQNDS